MEEQKFLKLDKDGWNSLSSSDAPFSNASLPEYGPFMENEDKLQLFKNIKGKKVLELGCAAGNSLKYLYDKGAGEIWGLDISENQINKAKENVPNAKLFVSQMENNPGIPTNYFDYVLLLYSIGYSSNIMNTIKKSYEYLKDGGQLIICWTHPFFNCLGVENEKVVVSKSYYDETAQVIVKGQNKIELAQYNYKISTIINTIINNKLIIDKIIEEDPIFENHLGNYISPFFDKKKLSVSPTTLILVSHK